MNAFKLTHPQSLLILPRKGKFDEVSLCLDQIIKGLRGNMNSIKIDISKWDITERVRNQLLEGLQDESHPFILPLKTIFPETFPPDANSSVTLLIRSLNEYSASTNINYKDLSHLHEILSMGLAKRNNAEIPYQSSLNYLIKNGVLTRVDEINGHISNFENPGIYRLQHASLLFKTYSASILIDPVFIYAGKNDWLGKELLPLIDAILISHSHGDHFCLTSLLQFPKTTLIIIPYIKKPSILCPDMAKILREIGFTNVIEASWYSEKIFVGDICISTLPFWGEQPWLNCESPICNFRNQGNTYLIDMMGTKSWILIDSGTEYNHSMLDLCDYVNNKFGIVDCVLSNLRSFHWKPKTIDQTGRYLLCFPESLLKKPKLWPEGELMTFGTNGMRIFLDKLQPRYFLPYAHWWQPLEKCSHKVGDKDEYDLLQEIQDSKSSQTNLNTKLVNWNVGSSARMNNNKLKIKKIFNSH